MWRERLLITSAGRGTRANLSRALERQNQGDNMAAGMIYNACGHEMGRRVGRTADPNLKESGCRTGGRPKRSKGGKRGVRLGRSVEVALTTRAFIYSTIKPSTVQVMAGWEYRNVRSCHWSIGL